MKGLERPEDWVYHCYQDRVQAQVTYPAGYKGQQALPCPRCNTFMEVISRPRRQPTRSNVISMFHRRQAQILADSLEDPEDDDYDPDPDA